MTTGDAFGLIAEDDSNVCEKFFELSFGSDLRNASKVIAEALGFVESQIPDISFDDRFELRLILSELLFNAVIHGNKSDIGKKVHIRLDIDHDRIHSVISDEGKAFCDDAVFIKKQYETSKAYDDDDIMRESGRGIIIVRGLADYVKYNDEGNTIRFIKRIKAAT